MSEVETPAAEAKPKRSTSSLLMRGAIWVAIGSLIAAAIVCVFWVLFGDQNGLIGRAFLTILLLAAFAGVAILDSSLAAKRPDWLVLASMITWIIALLAGAVKIWWPRTVGEEWSYVPERIFHLVLVVGVLQLVLLHIRLYRTSAQRFVTTFTRIIYYVTIAFLLGLAGMLVFWLTFPHLFDYPELYWRIVVALTILVAVGTMLIPLLNALFAPKKPRAAGYAAPVAPLPAAPAAPAGLLPWPTFADGVTPLPMLPDGSPDFSAYPQAAPVAPPAATPPVTEPPAAPQPGSAQFPPPPPPAPPR